MTIEYRKIIHIDMDAFYASIEQRDHLEYRGKPVAVGGKSNRGVVAAASYEARQFGVHSAMPMRTALQKCPDLIVVKPRFELYRAISQSIRDIFHEYTNLVEPLSLDEAFLDVTDNFHQIELGMDVALEIKRRIKETLNLTASAGVSYNKFLAKIASDVRKPDGLFVLHPLNAPRFVEALPIEDFFGVGAVTAKKMHALGIKTGKDLKAWNEEALIREFGKAGHSYYLYARAIDDRPVNPNRIRKSVGVEETFLNDLNSHDEVVDLLKMIHAELIRRCRKHDFRGRTLTLKIKYYNFKQITRSRTVNFDLNTEEHFIWPLALELLSEVREHRRIRLMGLTLHNSDEEKHELNNELNQQTLPFHTLA